MRPQDDLEARRAELQQRLAEATTKSTELQRAADRRPAIEEELADLDARLAHRKARRLPLLDRIRIASPCTASWEAMTGDERVRFCGQCEKNVYNLSAMTRDEAEALLVAREGSICVRLYQRADGTVLTTDCPEGVKRQRRRRAALAVAGAGAMATAAIAASALREPEPAKVVEASAVAAPPPEMGTATATGTAVVAVTGTAEPWPRRPHMGKMMIRRPEPPKPGTVTVPKRKPRIDVGF